MIAGTNLLLFLEAIKLSAKQLAPAFIVEKAKDHVLFTGTALIPGEPDCDYANGEKILTEQEVAKMAHEYIENYRIVDKEHEYFQTKEEIGTPLESYLLPAPMIMKSIDGVEREYPKGTWIVKTRITDPEIMAKAEEGKVAYSVTALPKESAEKLIAEKGRVLIKDLEDPVAYTLSLTEFPCVNNSCSTKSDAAVKERRSISKENKTILEKARDAAKEAIDTINNLLGQSQAIGEDIMTEKSEKDFVTKSDLEEFGKGLVEQVIEAIKAEEVEETPEAEEVEKSEEDKEKVEKSEEQDADKETNGSKAIKNHDDGKEEPAFKSMEFYMGRDARGRPLKKEE
jgi:hypothetical protein